jgi:hypothetical protein
LLRLHHHHRLHHRLRLHHHLRLHLRVLGLREARLLRVALLRVALRLLLEPTKAREEGGKGRE